MKRNFKTRGFGLVEILIATSIIGLALVGLAALSNFVLRLQSYLKGDLKAANLAIEAIEATKAIKKESWANFNNFNLNLPYHPNKEGMPLKWSLVPGAETIDGFSRQIIISEVLRDSDYNIVSGGGVLDLGTKKVTATVSWTDHNRNYQTTLTTYLTNWSP